MSVFLCVRACVCEGGTLSHLRVFITFSPFLSFSCTCVYISNTPNSPCHSRLFVLEGTALS
uniref:Secreted protein n=1 Tax=Echinococcus granulosus TaxID=6210 RepID=A0A068WYW9_ECHGR|nr:hypothetical protein EgrG_000685400 [Echinococcus granulosus]